MEAIGTLAGGIAHNFNNLLMGIQGNVSLLLRELEAESPHSKRLGTVEALVAGGSKLTAQLLGYARSGRVDVRTIDVRVAFDPAVVRSLGGTGGQLYIDSGFQLFQGFTPVLLPGENIAQGAG